MEEPWRFGGPVGIGGMCLKRRNKDEKGERAQVRGE